MAFRDSGNSSVRELAQDLVDEIEAGHLVAAGRGAAGPPAVAGAALVDLLLASLILAAAGALEMCGKMTIVLSRAPARKARGERRTEVVVGVPAGAVDDDEGACDVGIDEVR